MAQVKYRNVTYDTASQKKAKEAKQVILTYRGIKFVKEVK
jgi:hypothetical protein